MRRAAVLGLLLVGLAGRADEPVTVTAPDGTAVTVAQARYTAGVRRVGWLAADGKPGPFAFELREADSTTYAKGVVTLVPLSSVEAIRYDKDSVSVSVAGLKDPLRGSTQFKGINVFGVEGAGGTFAGGSPKGGAKGFAFAGAKPLPPRPEGTKWAVQIDQPKAKDPTLTVANLKALAALPGGREVLLDELPTRKGSPIRLADGSVEVLGVDPARGVTVERTGGTAFVPLAVEVGKQKGSLVGLVGEVPAGWKVFPWHTVVKITAAEK